MHDHSQSRLSGRFPASQYALTNLPWDYFVSGRGGVLRPDELPQGRHRLRVIITTVSPRYAREITTEEFGCGLEGLLRHRQNALFGILNGVDYDEWNTTNNPFLPASLFRGRFKGKTARQARTAKGIRPAGGSQRSVIRQHRPRWCEQKGVDIMLGALEEMLERQHPVRAVRHRRAQLRTSLSGTGRRFPNQVAVRIGFDEALSHRIEAGCDFFLMPSRFEPCGLNQMYSLRYGTIPIVRATGGLDDTVIDIREKPARPTESSFTSIPARALAKGIRKALALYGEPDLLLRFRQNAMAADFSWNRTAGEFVALYQKLAQNACRSEIEELQYLGATTEKLETEK